MNKDSAKLQNIINVLLGTQKDASKGTTVLVGNNRASSGHSFRDNQLISKRNTPGVTRNIPAGDLLGKFMTAFTGRSKPS